MTVERELMRVNNGLNTALHGMRTAKMAEDSTNFILLGLGIIVGILMLKKR